MFFLSNPVPFNVSDYEKQKWPGISGQLPFWLQVQKNSFITDALLDQV